MAVWSMPEMSPWKPPSLTFPPNSARMWIRFAVWQLRMGMLICVALAFGTWLIVTSPDRLFVVMDFSNCYASPAPSPCERLAYQGGGLNVVFTALSGALLLGVSGLWLLWELWSEVAPKPITDDFLRLLNDSFGRDCAQSVHVAVETCPLGLWLHRRRRDGLGRLRADDLDARCLRDCQTAHRGHRPSEFQTRPVISSASATQAGFAVPQADDAQPVM